MEKEINQIGILAMKDNVEIYQFNKETENNDIIHLTYDQIDLLIGWLKEAKEKNTKD